MNYPKNEVNGKTKLNKNKNKNKNMNKNMYKNKNKNKKEEEEKEKEGKEKKEKEKMEIRCNEIPRRNEKWKRAPPRLELCILNHDAWAIHKPTNCKGNPNHLGYCRDLLYHPLSGLWLLMQWMTLASWIICDAMDGLLSWKCLCLVIENFKKVSVSNN